jgi:hypothetical protein
VKVLIVHLGTIAQTLPATSIVKGLLKKAKDLSVTWVTGEESNKYIFKYNKNIDKVISFNELQEIDEVFDVLINLHPKFPHEKCKNLKIKDAFDYGFSDNFKNFVEVINGEECSNMNVFQMYYKLSGLTWRGEGYNIGYYPKSRSKRHRAGLAVAHANLRGYVNDNLNLDKMKIWHIPYKKNIFKKMDEINKCSKIITDDFVTLHLALYLRKYVCFLKTFETSTKIELFGNGEIYEVPKSIFQ